MAVHISTGISKMGGMAQAIGLPRRIRAEKTLHVKRGAMLVKAGIT